jgi:hypothetical protein
VTGAGRPLSPTLTSHDPQLVFAPESDDGSLELRINFGLFTGREATPAEIDLLGQQLLPRVEPVTIISERRHQIGSHAEGTLHQVVVKIEPEQVPIGISDLAETRGRLLEVIERWAETCFDNRHDPISDDLQDLLPHG